MLVWTHWRDKTNNGTPSAALVMEVEGYGHTVKARSLGKDLARNGCG